jgi:hypothetical protein
MIDFNARVVYFDEMRIPLDLYFLLIQDCRDEDEIRVALAEWKRLQEAEAAAAVERAAA